MATALQRAKIDATVRFALSFVLMLFGFALARGPLALLGVVAAIFGVAQAVRHFRRLAWILGLEEQQRRMADAGARAFGPDTSDPRHWRRATLPRRIFWLLHTVAEVDGRSGAREMDLVRRFLLDRFLTPEVLADLQSWRAPPFPRENLEQLVGSLRAELSDGECETIFWWCCMICLIDERFSAIEHDLLQDVAQYFGMPGVHARRIFQHAKLRVIEATRAGYSGRSASGGWGSRSSGEGYGGYGENRGYGRSSGSSRGAAVDPTTSRRKALQVLGLDDSADESTIRKRHRELVKRYHPDAHANLGPVAAQEATQRFKEVQAAYEVLVGKR